MEIILSFFSGLGLAALVALTYPYWPRNRLVQNRSSWDTAYVSGTDVLWRIISSRPGAAVTPNEGDDLKQAVLPFLVMHDRARIGVMPREALNPREEAYLALSHSAREMSEPMMRRACRRLPPADREIVEMSRTIFRMTDADLLCHVRSTVEHLRGQSGLPEVEQPGTEMKDAVMAWVEAQGNQDEEDDFAAVVGACEILDVISTAEANPELWHILIGGLDLDDARVLPIIKWILHQNECDRATAALALIRCDVVSLMNYTDAEECPAELFSRWQIARTVCLRSEAGGFSRTGLDLESFGEDNDQSGLLICIATVAADMLEHERVAAWPLPETLLGDDFVGSAPAVPYKVIDGALVLMKDKADGGSVIDMPSRFAAA